jgi:tetratricopeptide (TPR) repeat protein
MEYAGDSADVAAILNGVLAEPGIGPETAAECLVYLSHIALREGDSAGALKFADSALQRLYEHSSPTPSMEAEYLHAVADAECANGHTDRAEKYYRRALEQLTAAGRERSPVAMTVLNSWAIMSEAAGNPRRALELTDRALRISALNNPGSSPAPYTLATRGRILYSLGRIREAHDAYAGCVLDKAPRIQIFCLAGLALTSSELGERDRAEAYIQQAFEAEDAIVPTDQVMIAKLRAVRGQLALSRGHLADARTDLDAAVAGTNSLSVLIPALLPRAELDLSEGKYSAAEADARRLLSLARQSQGGIPYSNRTGLAWLALGRALANQGNQADSRIALRAAVEHLSNTVDPDHPMLKLARELAGT